MFNKTLHLLPILVMAVVPLVAAQSSEEDTKLAAGVIKSALTPADSSDESTSSETVFREAWPQLGFHDHEQCAGGVGQVVTLEDHTDPELCVGISDGAAIALRVEGDPVGDPKPENQGGCMLLYNDKGCGGIASLIDVPYNDETTCVSYTDKTGEFKGYKVSPWKGCAAYASSPEAKDYVKRPTKTVMIEDGGA